MQRLVWYVCLLCMCGMARGQTDYEYIYWFDGDDSSIKTIEASGNQLYFDADVSHLNGELHTLTVQVRDAEGLLSSPETRMFVLFNDVSVRQGYYWFDNEDNSSVELYGSGSFDVDVSALDYGLHAIHYMTVDVNGNHSSPETRWFAKIPKTANEGTVLCRCVIDGEPYHTEEVSAAGGIINWALDVSKLSQGVHSIQVQVEMPSGETTAIQHGMFVRTATSEELSSMKCYYLIDNSDSYVEAGLYNGSLYHIDLDVSALDNGLHQISYMLVGDNGVATRMCSALFTKIPVGGNGIAKYEYWLNDNDADKCIVEFEQHLPSYQLVSLLPVESVPIRSSLFHFEVDEEQGPMVYAKNEFHIRFYDAAGRLVYATKEYLDYNVSEKLTDTEEIKKSQTFARPAENGIKWFALQACEGDTIAFRSSQALSLQVFSPSGEEIYAASGAESVKWGGCHTWEEGTHYVAIHDVTGSQPNVTLDYMHMDKYDVVDQDVRVVGNGGCSTITFYGNGFNDLYAVGLVCASGDTIDAKAIHHESDATVNITFDFTDKTIGKYDAVFHFTTEDKKFTDILTVEEARDITLDIDVQYPSTFLRGTSVTYTIAVTNNGNATAYDVPLELRLRSGGAFSEIESVTFTDDEGKEFNNITLEDMNFDLDSLDEETVSFLDEEIDMLNRLQTFFVVRDSIANDEFGYADLHLTVAPHETLFFYVTLKSSSSVRLEATIPTEWITINTRDYNAQRINGMMRSSSQDGFCCYKEAVECTIEVVVNMVGFLPVSGCVGLLDHYTYTAIEIACSDGHSLGDKAKDFYGSMAEDAEKYKSYTEKGWSAIWGCVLGKLLEKYVKPLIQKIKALKGQLKSLEDKIRDSQRLRKLNLDLAEDATKQQKYYNKKNLEYSEEAARRLNDGDKVGAKEMYDAAAKAKEEADSYAALASKFKDKASSLNFEIAAVQKQIEEILDNIKQLRLDEIAAIEKIRDLLDNITTGIDAYTGYTECKRIWAQTVPNCPPNPSSGGGTSSPVNSYDPNAIYGYLSPSGSKFIARDSVETVNYRIEFENDTAFATSSAHVVEIRDTLDARFFELSTFAPTYFNIGDKREQLDGTPNFVRTVDMRPQINAVVQVEGEYDEQTGIARWLFTSLDPMTMEPTDDVMQGFLPVNHDGTSGIGDVAYRIGLKKGLDDGTVITNRASIIFDTNEPILTPTWTNIVDGSAPTSEFISIEELNDTVIRLKWKGRDGESAAWRYSLAVQAVEDTEWYEFLTNTTDTVLDYRYYRDIDYGFCVLATDSAGNVESTEWTRKAEFMREYIAGDADKSGVVNLLDLNLTLSHILGSEVSGCDMLQMDANGDGNINVLDINAILQTILNADGEAATLRRRDNGVIRIINTKVL